jgi:hypothetical protein
MERREQRSVIRIPRPTRDGGVWGTRRVGVDGVECLPRSLHCAAAESAAAPVGMTVSEVARDPSPPATMASGAPARQGLIRLWLGAGAGIWDELNFEV